MNALLNKKKLSDQCAQSNDLPLVVDLDGTLTPTDTLVESVIRLVKQFPLSLFLLPFWLLRGPAGFKEKVGGHVRIAASSLPYRESLLGFLRSENARGRPIVLATAAHSSIAHDVSAHLGLFADVLATEKGHNLKGEAKLQAIHDKIGGQFVYAGDNRADLPIWKAASAAILVGVSQGIAAEVRLSVPVEREFPAEPTGLATWLRALRVHQWLKNLLLFVPLLTGFTFLQPEKLATMAVAFLAFSLAASATYMANDMWDLENDRAHPRKCRRPFASAQLPLLDGLAVAGATLLSGFALAFWVSQGFCLMLFLYLVLTSVYSLALKEYVLADVIMLSLLYTLRIIAGAVAIGVALSSWLLAFSVFIFLSLALVKRCAELVSLGQRGTDAARGRDYSVNDLVVLWPLGVGSALAAVVVFGLFISAPETQGRYGTPNLLWLVAIPLIYWLARLWIKTARGEMHDDPVVYAIKDHGSRITVLSMVFGVLAAYFLKIHVPL